jgi:hypothetical protein
MPEKRAKGSVGTARKSFLMATSKTTISRISKETRNLPDKSNGPGSVMFTFSRPSFLEKSRPPRSHSSSLQKRGLPRSG